MNGYKIYNINNVLHLLLQLLTIMPISNSLVFKNSKIGNVLEYCSSEVFNPTCNNDHIIIMQTARYGHIQLGRCIDADFGHLGCEQDQLKYLDKQCSGKESCHIVVAEMEAKLPCATALVRYLEASYFCQRVSLVRDCKDIAVKSSVNYLSSYDMELSQCGLESTPLQLVAKPGQQINISIIDFGWESSKQGYHHKCPSRYGYIIDVEHNTVTDICGGTDRMKHVYLSESSRLQVVITSDSQAQFLLSYNAVGCPLFTNPPDMWIKQVDHIITVGCKQNAKTWKMRCISNNWIGLIGNCTQAANSIPVASREEHDHILGMPPVVVLSLIASVFVIIICITVTTILGFFCIRKHKEPVEKMYLAPMTLPLNATLTHQNINYPQQITTERKSMRRVSNPNDTIQSNNSPQYFILENRDEMHSEPVYDAVYQNVND